MSETQGAETQPEGQQNGDTHQADGTVTFESQEAFNALLTKRLEQQARNQFGDYDDVRAKAAKFDELEQASKTEADRQRERLEAAERELAATRVTALRATIASRKGIDPDLLSGATEEEIEAFADKLIAFRGEQQPARPGSAAIGRVNTQETKGTPAERFSQQLTGLGL